MAALVPDWLRHFRLLIGNRWTEFNETLLQSRSQRPLPSLYFSGRSVNKNGHPGRFLVKVAHCTQVHDMWLFGPLVYCSRGGDLYIETPFLLKMSHSQKMQILQGVRIFCTSLELYFVVKWNPISLTRHVLEKHGCPRRQQSQNLANISKSYILTPPHPRGMGCT